MCVVPARKGKHFLFCAICACNMSVAYGGKSSGTLLALLRSRGPWAISWSTAMSFRICRLWPWTRGSSRRLDRSRVLQKNSLLPSADDLPIFVATRLAGVGPSFKGDFSDETLASMFAKNILKAVVIGYSQSSRHWLLKFPKSFWSSTRARFRSLKKMA